MGPAEMHRREEACRRRSGCWHASRALEGGGAFICRLGQSRQGRKGLTGLMYGWRRDGRHFRLSLPTFLKRLESHAGLIRGRHVFISCPIAIAALIGRFALFLYPGPVVMVNYMRSRLYLAVVLTGMTPVAFATSVVSWNP